ncbi:MAG: DinB family protein [Calditrichota bacterium]
MSELHPLIEQNRHFLTQGIQFLEEIDDDQFNLTNHAFFNSSIGKHMRHVLDHYRSFVGSINGYIDYDARKRDEKLETDRAYAIEACNDLFAAMGRLTFPSGGINSVVQIRCNDTGSGEKLWTQSTFTRELQFLSGHTVHHYALISMILRILRIEVPEEFGVAPSTLKFESGKGRQCAQ